jgi:hypothetical protein
MYFPIRPVAPKTRIFEDEAAMMEMRDLIIEEELMKRGICL